MKIDKIEIKNYRNFDDFQVKTGAFNVFIGENDVGKTNLLKAIQLVLNPPRNLRYYSITEKDFKDIEQKIEIRIFFSDIESIISNNFQEIYDPVEDEIIIEFEAEWKDEYKDFNCTWKITNSDPDSVKILLTTSKSKFFLFFYIESVRNSRESFKFSNKGDIGNLIQLLFPEIKTPLKIVSSHIMKNYNELHVKYHEVDGLESFFLNLKELTALVIDNEPPIISFTELNERLGQLRILKTTILNGIDDIEEGEIIEFNNYFTKVEENLKFLMVKKENKKLVKTINKNFTNYENFQDFQTKLKDTIQLVLPFSSFEINLSNVEDIDIIKKVKFDFDDFSIFNHGDGFQSRVIIGLKILRLLSVVNSKGMKSVFVAIEEPEAHLHPHNQKDLLKRLKLMKKRIQQEHGIKAQFFITSHSSNILTEIKPSELIIMKKKDQVIPIQQSNDFINELSQQISSASGESLTKIRKGLLRAQENLFKFYPECFFSRVIIIGEGQTEEGAFPEFAKKLDLDLDSYGITYISILGGGKLSYYKYLLDKLQYDYFYVIDKDKGITDTDSRAFITEETAFEYEMFKTLPFAKILECISDLIPEDTKLQLYPRFASVIGDPTITNFEDFVLYAKTNTISNPNILKIFKKQFTKLKGSLLGYYVGSKCTIDEIPDVYKKIIEKAAEKSKEI